MAKNQRGGLGRGLDALLSSSYEESHDAKPSQQVYRQGIENAYEPEAERTVVVLNEEEEAELAFEARQEAYKPMSENQAEVEQETRALEAEVNVRPAKKKVPESKKIPKPVKAEAPKKAVEEPVKSEPITEPQKEEPQQKPIPKMLVDKESDEVAVDSIEPNPDQPRIAFKKEELEELAGSIARDGLLQPILVRPIGENQYQIIAGERRWQACKMAGLKTVPVRIKKANDSEAHILAMVENIQRTDLNPIEEAYGYRRMIEQGMTQAEVAQQLSKGRSTIANALRLLDLPEDAQQLLFEEKITAGHARAILSVPTTEGKQKLTEKLIKENLSVRQTENIARLLSMKDSDKKPSKDPAPKSYKMVARELKQRLGSPVKVKSAAGKNKIEIEFTDEEDLTRIFEIITNTGA